MVYYEIENASYFMIDITQQKSFFFFSKRLQQQKDAPPKKVHIE